MAGIGGLVHGGNQPVSGANIGIYTVGTTGYGSAGNSMLSGAVTTGSDGSFYFGNKLLLCPSGPSGKDRLYLTATGGNPGINAPSVNNDALYLMTVIDSCQALTTSSVGSDLRGTMLLNDTGGQGTARSTRGRDAASAVCRTNSSPSPAHA